MRILGIALMAAGFVLLLSSLPGWMWCTLLSVAMISVGYLIWRFG